MSWITDCALFDGIVEIPGAAALPPAILALSPVSYWDLRETSGTSLNDQGSLSNDGAETGWVLANTAGTDTFMYPTIGAGDVGGAPDQASYSPATNALTVGFLVRMSTIDSDHAFVSKYAGSGNREFQIEMVSDGRMFARLVTATGTTARQRISGTSFITTGVWYFIIVRFPTTTSFPTIRVNGTNLTGTTSGSGTGGANSTAGLGIGNRTESISTVPIKGSMAHVFIYSSAISDANCGVLEAAAQADGWF